MINTGDFSFQNLDTTDWKLLNILQANSNLSIKEIASRVNLSTTPVYERIKKLENSGCITKYVAILDAEKLGKSLTVFCNITLKEHTKSIGNQFVKDIISIKQVTECYNISGDYDFLLKIIIKDMKDYQDFVINKLGLIKNIGSAHSTFVLGVIKHSYGLPL
ncbi:Lrp/AsnC family transcriptional regulator [uncultured Algibacter sp.]|uniref:Lrp/AsnC family transcriptional regulator n=1 Tax=uncultured Algibacter sp. TaxID=298659 RepID=UPI003217C303